MMSDEVLGSPPTELSRLVQLWAKIKCASTYRHYWLIRRLHARFKILHCKMVTYRRLALMHGFLHQIENKDGASFVGHVLMAISACLTNNLTIKLLLRAKQKRQTGLFSLSSNCCLANVNILAKRRVQRRTRRLLDKARQDRFVVEKHDQGALLVWRIAKKVCEWAKKTLWNLQMN